MRILHTSDWHLGQYFMGKTRQSEHQAFLDWLISQLDPLGVDVVLVAGDVFDTGTPPSYAREMFNRFVVAMHASGVRLVVLGGNHDSVATLGESRELLACLATEMIPAIAAQPADDVLLLQDRAGRDAALLCAVPYIRPRDVVTSQAGESAADKQASLQQAIAAHYQTLYACALERRQALGRDLPIIATGHLATVGASSSDSVREIYVGSLDAFPTNAFPPADYIALGHIHRPQQVGGLRHIRYCGSPLPLGFDEADQRKQLLLAEFDAQGLVEVTAIEVPCFQRLVSLRGNLVELAGAIAELAAGVPPGQTAWLDVAVRDDDYLTDLQPRVQALCQDVPVELLRLRRERGPRETALVARQRETLAEMTPFEVFARRLDEETLDDARRERLEAHFREVLAGLGDPS